MTQMPLTKADISAAIRILRPILIILICWAHIPLLLGFQHPSISIDNAVSILGTLLRDTLSRAAVPLLTVISGYLAYTSYTQKSYYTFIKQKTRRILLPFIFWNVLLLILLAIPGYLLGKPLAPQISSIETYRDAIHAILGYKRLPINAPTYFLRDLFLILACTPLFMLISRQKHLAIGVTLIAGALSLTVLPLSISYNGFGLYRNDMPFFFLTGFVFARYGFTLHHHPDWKAVVSVTAFVLVCVAAALYLVVHKPHPFEYLRYRPAFGILLVLVLPFIVSFLSRHRNSVPSMFLAKLSPYSFTIFLSHILVVYSIPPLISTFNIKLSNFSPLWQQLSFLMGYSLLCIFLGVAIKMTYDALRISVTRKLRFRQ